MKDSNTYDVVRELYRKNPDGMRRVRLWRIHNIETYLERKLNEIPVYDNQYYNFIDLKNLHE